MFVVDEPYIAFDILDLLNTRIFLIPFYEGVIICTKVPGCVEKLLRKITQVEEIIDKPDLVPKVFQISPSVSGI